MFHRGYFTNTSREEIQQKMREEGFAPKLITDKPGFVYEPHKHPETKYLVCLEGLMKVKVNGKLYKFETGDKLIIPGNTLHSGIVGENGCVYFWSEKVVKGK